jgi:hypothetical protein
LKICLSKLNLDVPLQDGKHQIRGFDAAAIVADSNAFLALQTAIATLASAA